MWFKGSLIVVPLLKLYFGVSDWAIGMAGLVGNGATCLFVAFATSGLMFYTCIELMRNE